MPPSHQFTVGAIGAGNVAQTIARLALAAGHKVILSNSRGPESLAELVGRLGENASAGTVTEAARADVVLLAVGWDQVPAALHSQADWDGRIVIDATNQWHHGPGSEVDLGDQTGSEYIATLMTGARIVKAFNTVFMSVVAKSDHRSDGRLVIFLAGDDADAKATVSTFIDSLELAPVDLGELRQGGRLMQAGGPLIALHVIKIE
ncbi:MAG: NADPH-dependent F420 reductase [Streptosporangiaceae bacterium]